MTRAVRITYISEGSKEQGLGHIMNSANLAHELRHRVINCKRDLVIIDAPHVSSEEVLKYKESGAKVVLSYCRGQANQVADISIHPVGTDIPPAVNLRRKEGDTLYFYGPRYRILRPEFDEYSSESFADIGKVREIVIMLGGTDVQSLSSTVRSLLARSYEVGVIENQDEVAESLAWADLAIVSPGFGVWEALYVGTPVIIIPQNKDQEYYSKSFPLLHPKELDKLPDMIRNKDFVYLNPKYQIGEGKEELLEEMLR